MDNLLPAPIKNFIDAIFNAPLSFLNLILDTINNVSLVAGTGINLNNYFSFFGYLPPEWKSVMTAIMGSITFLALLFIIKSTWNVYLKVKGSIKWW